MVVAIVGDQLCRWAGSEAETWVRRRILEVFTRDTPECVVGAVHPKASVDLWALEEARRLKIPVKEYLPKGSNTVHLRACGILVAEASNKVVCIAARNYQPSYRGARTICEYCAKEVIDKARHIHNNGCWTLKYAKEQLNRETQLVVVGR